MNNFLKECLASPTKESLDKLEVEMESINKSITTKINDLLGARDDDEFTKMCQELKMEQQNYKKIMDVKIDVANILNDNK